MEWGSLGRKQGTPLLGTFSRVLLFCLLNKFSLTSLNLGSEFFLRQNSCTKIYFHHLQGNDRTGQGSAGPAKRDRWHAGRCMKCQGGQAGGMGVPGTEGQGVGAPHRKWVQGGLICRGAPAVTQDLLPGRAHRKPCQYAASLVWKL